MCKYKSKYFLVLREFQKPRKGKRKQSALLLIRFYNKNQSGFSLDLPTSRAHRARSAKVSAKFERLWESLVVLLVPILCNVTCVLVIYNTHEQLLAIPLIIYSHLSFQLIEPCSYGGTCVMSHKNLVYDLAHHESVIAQWLEHLTGIWKVMG